MADWNASQYLKFGRQRTQPAIDLVCRIGLKYPEKILDVGCGPGNSTRVLKERFGNALVTGIDNSENMIEKARADHPDIDFRLCDISGDLKNWIMITTLSFPTPAYNGFPIMSCC